MAVRKRTWTTAKGERKEAWVVDYVDQQGKRHIETYARKKEADERHAIVKVDVSKGIHTPLSNSITVAQAADDWITAVEIAFTHFVMISCRLAAESGRKTCSRFSSRS